MDHWPVLTSHNLVGIVSVGCQSAGDNVAAESSRSANGISIVYNHICKGNSEGCVRVVESDGESRA